MQYHVKNITTLGGLGESISRIISENNPIPFKVLGVNDSFGESGKPIDLLSKYGLDLKTSVNLLLM